MAVSAVNDFEHEVKGFDQKATAPSIDWVEPFPMPFSVKMTVGYGL